MATVQQLKSRIGQLKHDLSELERQLVEARTIECGLKPGDKVREKNSRKPRLGRFVRMYSGDMTWIRAQAFRKDGTLGSEVTFYDWERVEEADAA